jgi:hypothetical protein
LTDASIHQLTQRGRYRLRMISTARIRRTQHVRPGFTTAQSNWRRHQAELRAPHTIDVSLLLTRSAHRKARAAPLRIGIDGIPIGVLTLELQIYGICQTVIAKLY